MSGRFANLEFNDREHERDRAAEQRRTEQQDEQALLAAAHAEYRWGRFEPALRLYTRCLEANRAVVAAWVGQVQMLVQLEEHHEGRVWSDKALELFRNNGELLAAKGQACARLHDHLAAMACSDGSLQTPGSSAWRWIVRPRGDRADLPVLRSVHQRVGISEAGRRSPARQRLPMV